MGTARVQANNARIFVQSPDGKFVDLGEVDTFSARELAELKTYQAIGEAEITSQSVFRGWELSFEGGKINWSLAKLIHQQDKQIYLGGRSPQFKVVQRVTYFDDAIEEFVYNAVTIHGYEVSVPNQDALSESFSGFSGQARQVGGSNTAAVETDMIASILSAMGVVKKA